MSMLLDTNTVSELIRKLPDPAVETRAASHPLEDLFFSMVGEAELRYGSTILPVGQRRETLVSDIETVLRDAVCLSVRKEYRSYNHVGVPGMRRLLRLRESPRSCHSRVDFG